MTEAHDPDDLARDDDVWTTRLAPVRAHQAAWLATADELRSRTQDSPDVSAVRMALGQGFVLTTAQRESLGVPEARERQLVKAGIWTRPRAGAICVLDASRSSGPEIAAAAAALVHPGAAVSHRSAAALHGLPNLAAPPRPVLTRRHRSDAGGRPDVLLHACRCAPHEITTWHGVWVTTPARTVVDIARAHRAAAGLVAADAALRERLMTCDELGAAVDSSAGRPGVRAARRVLELADGRAESPLESLVRLTLVDGGVDDVEPQVWIDLDRGRARVDLALVDEGVVIEADGALKYRDDRVLWNEKLRHEAVQRAGWEVVRVTWDDVWRDPAGVVARVRTAAARQRRFRGGRAG